MRSKGKGLESRYLNVLRLWEVPFFSLGTRRIASLRTDGIVGSVSFKRELNVSVKHLMNW